MNSGVNVLRCSLIGTRLNENIATLRNSIDFKVPLNKLVDLFVGRVEDNSHKVGVFLSEDGIEGVLIIK